MAAKNYATLGVVKHSIEFIWFEKPRVSSRAAWKLLDNREYNLWNASDMHTYIYLYKCEFKYKANNRVK